MVRRPDPRTSRLRQGPRDMVLTLLALLAIIAPLVLISRACSFEPGGPEPAPGSAPTVDAGQALAGPARSAGFPVRLPQVPPAWRANSVSTAPLPPTSVVVRVGWLTPGTFIQLSQSSAAEQDVVAADTDIQRPTSTGTVDVDGRAWRTYPGRRAETLWATALDGATVTITGNATAVDFTTLARAVAAARPLPAA